MMLLFLLDVFYAASLRAFLMPFRRLSPPGRIALFSYAIRHAPESHAATAVYAAACHDYRHYFDYARHIVLLIHVSATREQNNNRNNRRAQRCLPPTPHYDADFLADAYAALLLLRAI